MSDTPPDRLSVNQNSPYFDEAVLMRGIGIRFKGVQRRDVEEYSISEGQPLTITLKGPVEAWFESPAPGEGDAKDDDT
jgi:hypothetical protein